MNAPNALAAPAADASRQLAISPVLAGFAIQAATMEDAMKVCEWLAKSSLIPKAYQGNPQAIWTAGAMGQKLGVDLFTSLTGIASINGRPSVWGDLLRGLILSHPLLAALEETMEGAGETLTAVCTITRKGLDPYTARYGIPDAKTAGLLQKDGPWKQYPADMLVNRAFGRAARRRFADVLSGLHIAEEMEDAREVEATVVPNVPEAKPAKEREAPAEQQTIADTTPTAPPAPTMKDVNEAAIAVHTAFKDGLLKSKAIEALKGVCTAIGVEKISLCPEARIGECLGLVKAAHAKLTAEAKAAADAAAAKGGAA